ncbi:MAG TPA: peptidylprolyl isomerase [Verrucomicrobiae bacterium]|nr:peptidylprolyl isomerase [Verrucomicrobiae bacterium]
MKFSRCAIFLFVALLFSQISRAGTLVTFHFFFGVNDYLGDVDVELYDQDKPVTVNNFLKLIEAGAYNNSFFHRLQPGFVLQGGGYGAFNPFLTNVVAPANYTNLFSVGNFGNITNEFKVGKFYSNTNWTIAMAKSSDPNSANSQFFFNLANNASSLDSTNNAGGFTVFGHTLRGTNILNDFNSLYYGHGLFDLQTNYGANGALFTQLPANWSGTNSAPYDDLVYFTISLLSEQVKVQTNGSRQISWNFVNGLTNNLEFSTNLPPVWHVLTNIYLGTNNISTTNYVDSATNRTRFYRVHVLYPNTPPD